MIRDVDGTVQVQFYQWSAHLGQYFRNISNIISYYNFSVTQSRIGYVNIRQHFASEETQVNSLKANPDLTPIPGLYIQGQWYLYENIRQHCKPTLAADKTCLKPKLPKPSTRVANDSCATSISTGTSADEPPAKRRKVVTCNICKNNLDTQNVHARTHDSVVLLHT